MPARETTPSSPPRDRCEKKLRNHTKSDWGRAENRTRSAPLGWTVLGGLAPARCAGWVGLANAYGVPEPEHPRLASFGELARDAAAAFTRVRTDVVDICANADISTRDTRVPTRRSAILSAPLGRGALGDDEVLELLAAAGAVLDANAGIDRWLAPATPATVRVLAPAEHRGVPFAFVPLVVTGHAALAGLVAGSLVDAALATASRGRYDVTAPPPP